MSATRFPGAISQRGFSLLELMVAIVIIGILIGAMVPAMNRALLKAKNSSLKMNGRVLQSIIQGYAMDHNTSLPTSRLQLTQSNSWQVVKNPFNALEGIATRGSALGASPMDNASNQSPVTIWFQDPQPTTSNDMIGTVVYIPYKTLADAQSDTTALPAGGDAGTSGYEFFTIEGMSQSDIDSGWTSPLPASRITNW